MHTKSEIELSRKLATLRSRAKAGDSNAHSLWKKYSAANAAVGKKHTDLEMTIGGFRKALGRVAAGGSAKNEAIRLLESYGILTSVSGFEDRSKLPDSDRKKIVNATGPAKAEDGKAWIVRWADGRGITAFKSRSKMLAWAEKQGEWAEIVSVKYGVPEINGKKIKVNESPVPEYNNGIQKHHGFQHYGDTQDYKDTEHEFRPQLKFKHGDYKLHHIDHEGMGYEFRVYHKDKVAGYGQLIKHGNTLHVRRLKINPEHAGKGVGTAVLGHYARKYHMHISNMSAGMMKSASKFGDRLMTHKEKHDVLIPRDSAPANELKDYRKLTPEEHAHLKAGGKTRPDG